MDLDDYREHSPYSDPGRHGGLLDAVASDIPTVAATARNVIVHYRAGGVDLPVDRLDEVNLPLGGPHPRHRPVPLSPAAHR